MFSKNTVWSKHEDAYNYYNDEIGKLIINDAVNITQIQNEYIYFTDMLKSIEKIKKKTPGNGFAKMKCKERIAELEKIFDEIDYAAQITYD